MNLDLVEATRHVTQVSEVTQVEPTSHLRALELSQTIASPLDSFMK